MVKYLFVIFLFVCCNVSESRAPTRKRQRHVAMVVVGVCDI